MKQIYLLLIGCTLFSTALLAGNPDRQGEAGAAQLLMNPWAPSAGLHTLGTSMVTGVEAMRLNPAGIARAGGTQVMLGYANYLSGADIGMQAIGVTAPVGKGGAFGLNIMSLDFGDIPVTTTAQPGGTGGTLNISFINIGLSYSHVFENRVSVGFTLRGVSESTNEVNAFGLALDAGVQYTTGENNEFKFGVSLRNLGSRMAYGGQGLATTTDSPDPQDGFELTLQQRATGFEMPSVANIGASYDFLSGLDDHRVTFVANFTANSFSQDQIGAGLEYGFREQFIGRLGYRTDIAGESAREGGVTDQVSLYNGLSAGASVRVPFQKGDPSRRFSVDYAWRSTRIYNGTHNIGISLTI